MTLQPSDFTDALQSIAASQDLLSQLSLPLTALQLSVMGGKSVYKSAFDSLLATEKVLGFADPDVLAMKLQALRDKADLSPLAGLVLPVSLSVPFPTGVRVLKVTGEGVTWPVLYLGDASHGGDGASDGVIEAMPDGSLRITLTGKPVLGSLDRDLYLDFRYRDADGTRHYVRDIVDSPEQWAFNRIAKVRYKIKVAENGTPLLTDGTHNHQFADYCDLVPGDAQDDETMNLHLYWGHNLCPNGQWTQVVHGMNPTEQRSGGMDSQDEANGRFFHPTGQPEFNLRDCEKRFYICGAEGRLAASYPLVYEIKDLEFYEELNAEPETQVYSLAASYDPRNNRLLATWNCNKWECRGPYERNPDGTLVTVLHEVRWATQDIHQIGWNAATPVPEGPIMPPGFAGYNGVVYDSVVLPIAGLQKLFVAIKPQNSDLFSQIEVPMVA